MKRLFSRVAPLSVLVVIAAVHILAGSATAGGDIKVPKPSGKLVFRIGETGTVGFGELPQIMTNERLNRQGWKIESVRFAQTELVPEALSRGEVQFGGGQVFPTMIAIQKGANIAIIVESQPNDWVLVAKKDIQKCENLSGRRRGIHSEGATTEAMARLWMARTCPGTKSKRLIISGSGNRAIAIMADQIDATYLQLSDWITVNKKQPGKFHILTNFSKELDIITGGVAVSTKWLESNKDIAIAYVAEILKTNRMITAKPNLMKEVAKKHLPAEVDSATLDEFISAYMAIGGWVQNGGLSPDKIEATIKFFTGRRDFKTRGRLKPGLTATKVADFEILKGALKIIGKVPGKR